MKVVGDATVYIVPSPDGRGFQVLDAPPKDHPMTKAKDGTNFNRKAWSSCFSHDCWKTMGKDGIIKPKVFETNLTGGERKERATFTATAGAKGSWPSHVRKGPGEPFKPPGEGWDQAKDGIVKNVRRTPPKSSAVGGWTPGGGADGVVKNVRVPPQRGLSVGKSTTNIGASPGNYPAKDAAGYETTQAPTFGPKSFEHMGAMKPSVPKPRLPK